MLKKLKISADLGNINVGELKLNAFADILKLKEILISDKVKEISNSIIEISEKLKISAVEKKISKSVAIHPDDVENLLNKKYGAEVIEPQKLHSPIEPLSNLWPETSYKAQEAGGNRLLLEDTSPYRRPGNFRFILINLLINTIEQLDLCKKHNDKKFLTFFNFLLAVNEKKPSVNKIIDYIVDYFSFNFENNYSNEKFFSIIKILFSNFSKREYFFISKLLSDAYYLAEDEQENIVALFSNFLSDNPYDTNGYFYLFSELENRLNSIYSSVKTIKNTLLLLDYIILYIFFDFITKSKASSSNLFIPLIKLLAYHKYPHFQKELSDKKMLYTLLSKINVEINFRLICVLYTTALLNDYIKLDSTKLLLYHINEQNKTKKTRN